MATLNINLDGIEKKLEYSFKINRGIYFVKDKRFATENCKTLDIVFKEKVEEKISSFKNFGVLSSKAYDNYVQYIIFPSADSRDVEDLASEMPEPARQNIVLTYELLRFQNGKI